MTDLEKIVYLCQRCEDDAECAALWSVFCVDTSFLTDAIRKATDQTLLNQAHKAMMKTHARANKWLFAA